LPLLFSSFLLFLLNTGRLIERFFLFCSCPAVCNSPSFYFAPPLSSPGPRLGGPSFRSPFCLTSIYPEGAAKVFLFFSQRHRTTDPPSAFLLGAFRTMTSFPLELESSSGALFLRCLPDNPPLLAYITRLDSKGKDVFPHS